MYNRFDSYYYSRPVSYSSYYPKVQKKSILTQNDQDTQDVIRLLSQNGQGYENYGGLSRGIKIGDVIVGKRTYNHHASQFSTEYYIHQWKNTNDLTKEHPVGTHLQTTDYKKFLDTLAKTIKYIQH